jgi:hypothetical protein
MSDKNEPPSSIIIDLLALFVRAKPRQRYRRPDPARRSEVEDEPVSWQARLDRTMPLTADEAHHYARVPLDHRGAPHVRSQLASFVAERAAIEAGRMKLYSIDDDINARHTIARDARAGLGHLAVSHRRKLAAFRACEAEAGRKFKPGNPHIARVCDHDETMRRMYGSPEEDRVRILQFHRRNAERALAERHGLPSRFSRYEAI